PYVYIFRWWSFIAFGVMEKGILILCSAGNSGPDLISLTYVSPWITTVRVSTMDRDFPSYVKLGSGATMKWVSLYKGRRNLLPNMMYHMVYTGSNSSTPDPGSLCLEGT
ncbi:subtilisin-like protease SBT1.3, partial [Tanacetum coccineum]